MHEFKILMLKDAFEVPLLMYIFHNPSTMELPKRIMHSSVHFVFLCMEQTRHDLGFSFSSRGTNREEIYRVAYHIKAHSFSQKPNLLKLSFAFFRYLCFNFLFELVIHRFDYCCDKQNKQLQGIRESKQSKRLCASPSQGEF